MRLLDIKNCIKCLLSQRSLRNDGLVAEDKQLTNVLEFINNVFN